MLQSLNLLSLSKMALPFTSYKTEAMMVPGLSTQVYEAPTGFCATVLLAQVNNTDGSQQTFTMEHKRSSTLIPVVSDFPIPSKEVLYACGNSTGSLVLEPGDSLWIYGSSNDLAFILSVLELPVA